MYGSLGVRGARGYVRAARLHRGNREATAVADRNGARILLAGKAHALLRVFLEELDRLGPGLLRCLFVRAVLAVLLTEETVTGAFVAVRGVGLAQFLHLGLGGGNAGANAGVGAAEVTIDRTFDLLEHRRGWIGAVIDDG